MRSSRMILKCLCLSLLFVVLSTSTGRTEISQNSTEGESTKMGYAICTAMDDDGLGIPWDMFKRYYAKIRKSGALVVTDEAGCKHFYVCGSLNGSNYVWTWFDEKGHVERFETLVGEGEKTENEAAGSSEKYQENVLVYERFPFDTEYIYDSTMPEEYEMITQDGVVGLAQTEYLVTYVDGVDISWDFVGSQYIVERQNQIIVRGTKKDESASSD